MDGYSNCTGQGFLTPAHFSPVGMWIECCQLFQYVKKSKKSLSFLYVKPLVLKYELIKTKPNKTNKNILQRKKNLSASWISVARPSLQPLLRLTSFTSLHPLITWPRAVLLPIRTQALSCARSLQDESMMTGSASKVPRPPFTVSKSFRCWAALCTAFQR